MEDSREERIARAERWDAVVNQILHDPATPYECPFCHTVAVRGSWAVYHRGPPRAASFGAECAACGEHTHCAVLLPPEAPDTYPVRSIDSTEDQSLGP